jgi:hypothetical protein
LKIDHEGPPAVPEKRYEKNQNANFRAAPVGFSIWPPLRRRLRPFLQSPARPAIRMPESDAIQACLDPPLMVRY